MKYIFLYLIESLHQNEFKFFVLKFFLKFIEECIIKQIYKKMEKLIEFLFKP